MRDMMTLTLATLGINPTTATVDQAKQARDKLLAAQEHSGTNNHEAGADEPDLVKTDGRRIVTVTGACCGWWTRRPAGRPGGST